jgi:hypothetical protein
MCVDGARGLWRLCPGCGRERRLAPSRSVMCGHSRWDSASLAMVPCEGSGQQAHEPSRRRGAVHMPVSGHTGSGDGSAA